MRKVIAPVVALIVIGVGLAALFVSHTSPEPITSTYFLMDTVLTIKTTGGDAATINEHLYALASNVDSMTSYYKSGSETVRVNAAAGKGPVPVSPEYAALLKAAVAVEAIDHGRTFDIAISPVSSLWGFTTKDYRVPAAKEISDTLAYSHSDQLVLSDTTVQLRDSRARIDLGGIAKGYSLDVMEEYLRTVEPQPLQVNINFGGNLLLYSGGRKHDWKIGIQDPRGQGIIGTVRSGDAFVATSGDYERYFEQDGKRYCHIIDPSTGYPGTLNQSVTVITNIEPMHGAIGDALGKVFFCSTAETQRSLFQAAQSRGTVGIVIVDGAGTQSTLGPITFVPTAAQ